VHLTVTATKGDGPVLALAFTSDSKGIGIASTISIGNPRHDYLEVSKQVWAIRDLASEGCARVTRDFTAEEWRTYLPGQTYERVCTNLTVETGSNEAQN
jgi:hypothetical protein